MFLLGFSTPNKETAGASNTRPCHFLMFEPSGAFLLHVGDLTWLISSQETVKQPCLLWGLNVSEKKHIWKHRWCFDDLKTSENSKPGSFENWTEVTIFFKHYILENLKQCTMKFLGNPLKNYQRQVSFCTKKWGGVLMFNDVSMVLDPLSSYISGSKKGKCQEGQDLYGPMISL